MVINERNSLINSFVKGMNADLAFDLIENQQYIFGRNIRITKNLQIGEASDDDYTSLHEGIITPVPKGVDIEIDSSDNLKGHKILAIDTIDNLGTIVTKSLDDNTMCVFKFHLYERTGGNEDYCPSLDLMFKSLETIGDIDKVSTVLYRELYNVVKLYIADGIHPMITIRVDDDTASQPKDKVVSFDDVISNRILPQERVYIQNKISGRLKTGQVLYTYRYYNKYGITTQLAPLTNKIQVIDSNRNKEIGNAQDTETSVGFSLKINSDEYKDKFERLQIYRLHYIKKDQDAEISLIYDGEIVSQFNDIGIEPLQSLTIEEFYALSGIMIVPKVIEHNQQYMFASNITDDTIMKDLNINLPDAHNKYLNQVETGVVIANKNNDDEFVTPSMSGENFNSTYIGGTYKVSDYFKDRDINPNLATSTYNNIFTSSLLRSLRRGETYKYGIVYYDSHGRRSDVHNLGTIDVSPILRNMSFVVQDGKCIAKPIGVKIRLPQPVDENGDIYKDIIGCQIVRRSSSSIYQNTLMQVALARPIRQPLYNTTIEFDSNNKIVTPVSYSPYYPTGFLWSDYTRIGPGYYVVAQTYYDSELPLDYDVEPIGDDVYNLRPSGVDNFTAISKGNEHLFLIFSSEIDFRRNDALSTLTLSEVSILPLYAAAIYSSNINNSVTYTNDYVTRKLGIVLPFEDCTDFAFLDHPRRIFKSKFIDMYNGTRCSENNPVSIYRRSITLKANDKTQQSLIFNLYTTSILYIASSSVKNVKDVKMAKWYEGFSNIDIGGEDAKILTGISQYRSYTTTIDEYMYNNWVSFGLYDLRISAGTGTQVNVSENQYAAQFLDGDSPQYRQYPAQEPTDDLPDKTLTGSGYIGPGGSCLLITTGGEFDNNIVTSFGTATAICNITHKASLENNEPDEFVQYFGFGNYFKLKFNNEENKYVVDQPSGTKDYMYVFDGDIYITPHELTTMYKAYDFNSKDTLQSILVINYVPLESKVNTCFDYGMNYVNTTSANLLNESGTIDGVVVQDRPPHQYNIVYSDNDSSTDIFTLTITDKKETNRFSLRTYFSEPKTNGEFIDNFSIFKAASFIDADSRYGQITELFSDSNTLFFWLDGAFGKFSVNERSLINDQEGNTIMLGQAGILSRYDYISTIYGMRLYDFCEVSAEHGIYWVDINNRAIVAATTKTTGIRSTFSATNYGEALNVQNIINANISTDRPLMDYDVQNNELLCKCFKDGSQLVFNLKYNMATSLYDRDYVDIAYIKNHIYGLSNINDNPKFIKYNYLDYSDNASGYLTPLQLDFIVNPVASITKVYDSLTLIPIKRRKAAENKDITNRIFHNTTMSFETDILPETSQSIQPYTDREGNIIYNVPRFDSSEIGNRIRGKWMRVNITRNDPDRYFTISHIITKFRQSYS